FKATQRPNIAVDDDVCVAQASTGAVGHNAGQRAVVDLKISLDTRSLLELPVDLGCRQLALLELHVLQGGLGTFENAERPGGIRFIAGPREREVQSAAQVVLRQDEVESAVSAREDRDVLMRIGSRAIPNVDRPDDDNASH